MKISIEDIEKLAFLARIGMDDAQKAKYAVQIQSILDYFEKLNEIDTENVEEISHITGLLNIVREDQVLTPFDGEKALNAAPELENHCIKVKSVFKGSH